MSVVVVYTRINKERTGKKDMKKLLAIIAAMSLVLAMTACGNTDAGTSVTQGGAAVDADGNEIKGSTIDGAGKEVDMDKLEGQTLAIDENVDRKPKGDIGNYYVSIDEAKVVETEESKILVVAFTYENNSSEPAAFSNVFSVETTQNQAKVMPGVVNLDGINVLSGVEIIDPGQKTKVQKTYFLTDEENPVEVMVYKYGESTGDAVKKIFKLK